MSIGRQMFRRSAIYSGAAVLEKIASFLLLPVYAHIFQAEGYGIIAMVDVSVGVLTIALSSGYYNAILTTYHEVPAERRGRVISTATLLQCGLALIAVPLPMFLSPQLSGLLLGDARYAPLLVLALATLVVDLSGAAASSRLLIDGRSVLYSSIALVRFVVAVSLNILLVIVLRVGIIGIFVSSLTAAAVSAGVFLWVTLRHDGLGFDRAAARRLIGFQLPLVPAELVAFISRQFERILVRFMLGLHSVGVLEMAYKFPPILNWLVVGPFMMAWRAKSVEIGALPDAPREMGRMLTNVVYVMLLAGTMMAAGVGPLITVLTPREFWQAASIARVEVATTIVAGVVTFLQFGLIYRRRTGRLAFIGIVVSLSKMTLSVYLIQQFGMAGAAYSALVMQIVTLGWTFQESQRSYAIDIERGGLLLLTAAAAALWLAIAYLEQLPHSPAAWIAHTTLPVVRDFIETTALADWKSGKVLSLIDQKALPIATFVFNTSLAATFACMIVVVRPEVSRFAFTRVRRAVGLRPSGTPARGLTRGAR